MPHPLLSPDNEVFTTPPTTPGIFPPSRSSSHMGSLQPSLSRRNSRPSTLTLDPHSSDRPDIILDDHQTPPISVTQAVTQKLNGHSQPHPLSMIRDSTVRSNGQSSSQNGSAPIEKPLNSPFFVHSYLDKGASLNDWLRTKQNNDIFAGGNVGVASSLQHNGAHNHTEPHSLLLDQQPFSPPGSTAASAADSFDEDFEEDEFGSNLTKQLAETAVGVREMSKQLGRCRVRSNVQNVLIITKARDNRLIKLTRQLALYLMLKKKPGQKRGLVVYVDNQLRKSKRFDAEGIERDHPELFASYPRRRTSSNNSMTSLSSASGYKEDYHHSKDEGQLRYWTSDMCSNSPHLFDFVVTLGGDGTVLFTSWLFQRIVPPVLPFALGSLGFLTNFDFADHAAVMDSVIDSGIRVNLRMRFTCTVYRAVNSDKYRRRRAVKKGETGEILMRNVEQGGWEALEGGWSGTTNIPEGKTAKDKEIMCFTTRPVETFEVLNDLVVDRGPSPYMSLLELFGDEHHMTTVQADGLTVSTPTGSTAYSLSAGGSLVHPEIPALLITPICPHTLSFRPMLLPDSMELRICVPFNSRSTAWASFDGRGRVELKQGDHIKITASKYPFPTICADKQSTDWFGAISRTLKWNERERQKSFVMVEEDPSEEPKHSRKKRSMSEAPTMVAEETIEDEEEDEVSDEDCDDDDEEEEEEEEEKYDIDDSSPEAPKSNPAKADSNSSSPDSQPHTSRPFQTPALQSGINSPYRFAGSKPQPPLISPRHVEFALNAHERDRAKPLSPSSETSAASNDPEAVDFERRGLRDDINSSRKNTGKSRIPKDRETDIVDAARTPTVATQKMPSTRLNVPNANRSRSRSVDGHRTFAVWGHDESDSNPSDTDY